MPNAFDQFDVPMAPSPNANATNANPFDQFDSAAVPPATQQPTLGQKLEQTWPAQLAEHVYRSIVLPGDVATGKTNVTPAKPGMWSDEDEARLQATNAAISDRARDLAQIASPMSAAARAGEGAMGAAVTPKEVPKFPGAPTIQQLHDAADGDYSVARAMDVNLHPQSVAKFAGDLQQKLEKQWFRDYKAPDVFTVLRDLQNPPEGAAFNIADIDGIRRIWGDAAADFTNPTQQRAATQAIKALDQYVKSVPQADVMSGDAQAVQNVLESARGNYAAAKRAELIEGKEERAALQAGATGSGGNINNALRQKMKEILNNQKAQRGFTDDELDQMRRVVMGSPAGNVARLLGKLAPTGIVSGALSAGPLMLATGEPLTGAILPAVGAVAKKLGDVSTQRGINALSEAVRSRSPLAAQLRAITTTVPPKQLPAAVSAIPRIAVGAQRQPLPMMQMPAAAYGQDQQQGVPRPPSQ